MFQYIGSHYILIYTIHVYTCVHAVRGCIQPCKIILMHLCIVVLSAPCSDMYKYTRIKPIIIHNVLEVLDVCLPVCVYIYIYLVLASMYLCIRYISIYVFSLCMVMSIMDWYVYIYICSACTHAPRDHT